MPDKRAALDIMRPFPHDPDTFINDPDHWQARADYMRAVAGIVDELQTKSRMLRIAADYDQLASRAEERLLNVTLS